MKRTIYSVLSLIFLGSSITLFGMNNGLPKPNFATLDEIAGEPLGSDTEDDISALRSDFNALKQQWKTAANQNVQATAIAGLEQLINEARQRGDQQLTYDIAKFLSR